MQICSYAHDIQCDLTFVQQFKPDIVILEVGTNNLLSSTPEAVGSKVF
jgi:chemotaxis response regulator CheB